MESPTNRLKQTRPKRQARGRQLYWRRLILFIAILALLGAGVVVLTGYIHSQGESSLSRQRILDLFKRSDWAAVRDTCDRALVNRPLDVFYLGMKGIASFYDAMSMPPSGTRDALLGDSIVSIRKSLVAAGSEGSGIPRAQLEYILAKAYYHSGDSDMDLAATYMMDAEAHGYAAPDIHEYLGMIESSLGNNALAMSEFDKAMATDSSPMLRIAAAGIGMKSGNADKAERLLKEAISATQDAVATEKARLMLAQIYFTQSRWTECEGQLESLLSENPESAEAHFQLGLLYQAKGDSIHARAEWRKAVSIDPMHAGARQKLAERS